MSLKAHRLYIIYLPGEVGEALYSGTLSKSSKHIMRQSVRYIAIAVLIRFSYSQKAGVH